jgi:hypothetical protein
MMLRRTVGVLALVGSASATCLAQGLGDAAAPQAEAKLKEAEEFIHRSYGNTMDSAVVGASRSQIDSARRNLDAARQYVSDLLDGDRREGILPGWLR